MQKIQVFTNERFGNLRTVMYDGQLWFVAADVCHALEINNPSQALTRLDSDEKMTLTSNDGHSGQRGGAQFYSFVNLDAQQEAAQIAQKKPFPQETETAEKSVMLAELDTHLSMDDDDRTMNDSFTVHGTPVMQTNIPQQFDTLYAQREEVH